MKLKRLVGINLIAFHDTKSVGTFIFMKRFFMEMARVNLDDYHFIVYCQSHIEISDWCIPNNISCEYVYVPRLYNAIFRIIFEQTLFYFYSKKQDVLFSPTLSMPIFLRSRKILTIHDMIPYVFPNKYGRVRQFLIAKLTTFLVCMSDKVIAVSDNSKKDIINILKIDDRRVSVIYNFIPKDEPILKYVKNVGVDFDLSVPYFLTVSTLQPAKNIIGLIRAFDSFSDKYSNYELFVVGNKGWGYDAIFLEYSCLKNKDKIHFTGYLSEKQLSVMYQNCFGVLYLSFYEGFGIPPLEGFYFGKACVASSTSSLPEVVGNAGVLVDPYNQDSIINGLILFLENHSLYEMNVGVQMEKFKASEQLQKLLFEFL